MTRFPHGCDADYEHEQIDDAERRAHEAGECDPKICWECWADRERAEESLGG